MDFRTSKTYTAGIRFKKMKLLIKKLKLLKLIEVEKLHYIIQVKKLFILL